MTAGAQGTHAAELLGRLLLLAMVLALAAVLTAAMVMQYAFGEVPCPLCLLQRFAMFGCCFGLLLQLRSNASERGTGIGLIFAVLLLVISVRQTLLDIYPRPGHGYVGSAIMGLHMPVWSVLISVALLLGFACRLAFLTGPDAPATATGSKFAKLTIALFAYVVLICAVNVVSVLAQCGAGECHTTGYWLFQ